MNTSKALEPFEENRSHVSVWNWVQRFNPKKIYPRKRKRKRRVTAFIIDETMIQTGSSDAWLWVAIEPVHSTTVLGVFLSRHRNMLVVESFLRSLVKVYGKHTLYILMVELGTLKHVLLSLVLSIIAYTYLKKSLIERAIQYFKDRTENFDGIIILVPNWVYVIYHMYTNG
jgi:putative transposase